MDCPRCALKDYGTKPRPDGVRHTPTTDQPSVEELMAWEFDSASCEATDGCTVEPDGRCPHGHPSWMLVMSLI